MRLKSLCVVVCSVVVGVVVDKRGSSFVWLHTKLDCLGTPAGCVPGLLVVPWLRECLCKCNVNVSPDLYLELVSRKLLTYFAELVTWNFSYPLKSEVVRCNFVKLLCGM